MKGSEKQIAWAEDIKASVYRCFTAMEHNVEHFAKHGMIEDTLHYDMADVEAVKAVVIPQIEAMDDASMIIKFRNNFTQENFTKMAIMHHAHGC